MSTHTVLICPCRTSNVAPHRYFTPPRREMNPRPTVMGGVVPRTMHRIDYPPRRATPSFALHLPLRYNFIPHPLPRSAPGFVNAYGDFIPE
ncbi:MAG: hypothetical protein MJ078_04120, partial [Clostridia bacterium]|nr:hypothetical protein [Clostridia bacterium]